MYVQQTAGLMTETLIPDCFPMENVEIKNYRNSYKGIAPEIVRTIRREAKRAIGKTGFREHDLADIEQELMLDVLQALPMYDSRKGSRVTLVQTVARRTLNSLRTYRQAQMRDWRKTEALNEEFECEEGTFELVDLVATDGQLFRNSSIDTRNPERAFNLKLDIDAVLEKMPDKLQRLCEDLKFMTISEAAEKRKVKRSTVYRLIKRIRKFMEESSFCKEERVTPKSIIFK